MDVALEYLAVVQHNFHDLKHLGDKALAQLQDDQAFHWVLDDSSNSIAVIIRHLHGNMVSRFSDFLTTDGEKPNRNRDDEFTKSKQPKEELLHLWEAGWQVVFATLRELTKDDLLKTVRIRNEPHSVMAAIHRQVAHYATHVGQIVLLAKHIQKDNWQSLSIPKGKSAEFNQRMFDKEP